MRSARPARPTSRARPRRFGRANAHRRRQIGLAGVGGTQLESLRGVHLYGVKEAPTHELHARDERRRRLDVALD